MNNLPLEIKVSYYTFKKYHDHKAHSARYILKDFVVFNTDMIMKLLALQYSNQLYIDIDEAKVVPENISVELGSDQLPYKLRCDLVLVLA